MSPLSLAALTILDAGPAGQIRAAHAAGFTSVGLRLQPLLETDAVVVGNAEAEKEVLDLLHATGVGVLEVGVFPIRAYFALERFAPVIAFSARVGAKYLVCPVEDEDLTRRSQSFAQMCDQAGQHGLMALVEFNPYSGCRSLREALELVDRVSRGNAGLVIDALHLSRSGGHPDDLRGIAPRLLRLVHLCDAPPPPDRARSEADLRAESRTARLLPGEGTLWLSALMAALPDDVGVSIEAPSAAIAHLSAEERARRTLEATQRFFSRLPS